MHKSKGMNVLFSCAQCMRAVLPVCLCFACLFLFAVCVKPAEGNAASVDQLEKINPRRIVSLAPSITEILFMLGLGDQVAGVTRYCVYPEAARFKRQIGGYCDPNYEAITALRPDLVVMLREHEDARRNLKLLGLNTLVVDHHDIAGILSSITAIGRACGKEQAAMAAAGSIEARMQAVGAMVKGLPRPRVMVCVGRNMGSSTIENVHINGRKGFYQTLIEQAGGENAYTGGIAYPSLSREGMLRINPEVIIDMTQSPPGMKKLHAQNVLAQWRAIPGMEAVRKGRVFVFDSDYAVIPGPRFINTLEDMARAIHPEAAWP